LGGLNNTATTQGATIGGGEGNTASGQQSTISGGSGNQARQTAATVGGGALNDASGQYSTISGGDTNVAAGFYSNITGGRQNTAPNIYSRAGGFKGRADRDRSDVFGFEAGQKVLRGFTTSHDRTSGASFEVGRIEIIGTTNTYLNLFFNVVISAYSGNLISGNICCFKYSLCAKVVSGVRSIVGTPLLISNFEDATFIGSTITFSISGNNLRATLTLPSFVGTSGVSTSAFFEGNESRP